jgi:SRSO17 transposase
MRSDEIAGARGLLEEFVQAVFASLPRKDQRGKGGLYLQGLMLDGRRKSMQPMGDRLGIDYQQLQRFVSSSFWPVEPVRRALAAKAVELIRPRAWVIDDTGFAKDGRSSPGVARQYSGTLGKVGNCRVAVSVNAVTDAASCPLDWRLFLPGPGTTPARTPTKTRNRPRPGGRRRRSRTRYGTGPSGSWPWR